MIKKGDIFWVVSIIIIGCIVLFKNVIIIDIEFFENEKVEGVFRNLKDVF